MEVICVSLAAPPSVRKKLNLYGFEAFTASDNSTARPTLFHGTPASPALMGESVLPSQAINYASGRNVPHGPGPAVCASSALLFPSARSLLHDDHPALTSPTSRTILRRRTNAAGSHFLFTSLWALGALENAYAEGYVYASAAAPASAKPYDERPDLHEWRMPDSLRWDFVLKVLTPDLPPEIVAVDDSDNERLEAYFGALSDSTESPFEVARRFGITAVSSADVIHR